jgi:Tol biopolymer transport system component
MFAISADGRRLAFVSSGPGERILSIRDLDSFEAVPVPGSNDAVGPFWSEDGQSIGFSARGKMWRWRLAGSGEPIPICDVAPNGAVATWANGVILFSDAPGVGRRPIMRVAESGGRPEAITTIDEKARQWRHGWPRFLPGGEEFVYQIFTTDSVQRSLVVRSLADEGTHVVIENVSKVAFSGEDLLYVRDGTLFAQRFDRSSGRLGGDPRTLAPDVGYFYATAAADFDASASGVVIFRRDSAPGDFVEVDRTGAVIRELGRGEDFHSMDLSRDGRRAVVSIMDRGTGLGDLWIYDLTRGLRERFTNDPGMEVYPIFTPDGNSVVFSRTGGGLFPYLVRRGINASADQLVGEKGHFDVATGYSRDGRSLYFFRRDPTTQDRSFRRRFEGAGPQVEPFLGSSFRERDVKESPSGEWIAYSMDATGNTEVYIQSTVSTSTPRIRVSSAGGRMPRWSRDGRELFYISADRTLVSASPGKGGRWEEPILTPLFKTQVLDYVASGKDAFLLCRPSTAGADMLFHVLISR